MKIYERANDITKRLSISNSTLWRWVAAGKIPEPYRPTKRCSLFDVVEIQNAIENIEGRKK